MAEAGVLITSSGWTAKNVLFHVIKFHWVYSTRIYWSNNTLSTIGEVFTDFGGIKGSSQSIFTHLKIILLGLRTSNGRLPWIFQFIQNQKSKSHFLSFIFRYNCSLIMGHINVLFENIVKNWDKQATNIVMRYGYLG